MKKLSVIVAAFKAAPYIGEMLQSFEKQKKINGWEYEIRIGVDACGETARELDILGIEYYKTESNVGAYVVRNSLIALGHSDIYTIFDADDIMEPDYLSRMIPLTEKHGFASSHKLVFKDGDIINSNMGYGGGICFFTHELLEKLGGFSADRVSSDLDFTLRAMQSGIEIAICPEPLWRYRRLETSLTGNPATDCRSAYRAKIEARQDIQRSFNGFKIIPVTTEIKKTIPFEKSIDPKTVSIIAFAPGDKCAWRKRNWEWLKPCWLSWGFELIEISAEPGATYNKAALAHAGAKAASGDVLVFTDADVFMDRRGLARAIGAVCSGSFGWATPNNRVCRYTDAESEAVGNGGAAIPSNAPYVGQMAGGLFIVSRKCWDETGGMDTRFEGWGGEDSAYSIILAQRGDGWQPRGTEILWHLWHPEQISKIPGEFKSKNEANNELFRQYRAGALSVDRITNNNKAEANMEIRIVKETRIDGKHCEYGQVMDVDNKTAYELIRWGNAVMQINEGKSRDVEAVNPAPEAIEDNAPKMKAKGNGNNPKRK